MGRPKLRYKIWYDTAAQMLYVTAVKGQGIDSDWYTCVLVYLMPGDDVQRTKAVDGANPSYNDTFSFKISATDVREKTIVIRVWNSWSEFGDDIGEVQVPLWLPSVDLAVETDRWEDLGKVTSRRYNKPILRRQREAELKKEEEEKRKIEAEMKKEEEERRQREEKIKKEEEERRQREEKIKKEEEERRQREEKIKKEEEERRQREEKIKKEEEEKRKIEAEIKKEEEERRQREEKIKKEEEEEKRQIDAKRKKDEEMRQREVEKLRYLTNAKTFAAFCKKGKPVEVAKYLEHNKNLLNCLGGEPLRQAAQGNNIRVLQLLMEDKDLQINMKDSNGRTALHKGSRKDLPEIVSKLLSHSWIDVNPVDTEGLTPVMEAAKFGKFESLKVLLEDSRVDLDMDDDDGTIEELLGTGLKYALAPQETAMARKLFKAARSKVQEGKRDNKLALIVVNCDYGKSKLEDLEGPHDDLKLAVKLFTEKGYRIHVIKDSDKINEDVLDWIEDNQLEETTEIFQLFYSGHGVHKSTAEKGMLYSGDNEKADYRQEGEHGDCLVNCDGTLCEELLLSYQISDVFKKETELSFFYDMCRSEEKDATILKKEHVIVSSFEWKQMIQKSGADRRMVKIFSSQIGETSSGSDSFFKRICKYIEDFSPRGVKFVEMMNMIEQDKQKCQIECVPGWDNRIWPLQ